MRQVDRAVDDLVREPAFEAQNRAARQRAIHLLNRDRSGDPRLPWKSVDNAVGTLSPGDLLVVAGGPGSGKTAVVLNIASRFLDVGVPWACFGLELDAAVLTQFLAGLRCGFARYEVRDRLLTDIQHTVLEAEIESLIGRTGEMHFAPEPRFTAADLVTRVRSLVSEMGVRVVFVDHLHHLDYTAARDLRRGVTDAMHLIKTCATETGVTFLVVSQLARRPGQPLQPWCAPSLSELKESGAIEQLADIVLFTHRQIHPDKRDAARAFARGEGQPTDFEIPGRLGLTLRKHRFGKPIDVTIPLTVHVPTDRITEAATDTWEEVNVEDRPLRAAASSETPEQAERRALAEGA